MTKDELTESMEKACAAGRKIGLAEAADIALKAFSVATRGAQDEMHAQRVEAATGGDQDPS